MKTTNQDFGDDDSKRSKQSLGGEARAQNLSPDKRREIARDAAKARWRAGAMLRETHSGILRIGDHELPCSVLNNGMRVFSTRGLGRVFGSAKDGRNETNAPKIPAFLSAEYIKPHISEELLSCLIAPVSYRAIRPSGVTALGYPAIILPQICEAILDATSQGSDWASKVHSRYRAAIRSRADMLLRGFARVGIIALIDEATGYQEDRARDELTKILEAYIAPELMPWTRKFPDEFFRQVYRLHQWEYKPENAKKGPRYVGKLINKYVYDELPPGVPQELRRLNPPNERGQRAHKHFQLLTADTGNPHLDKQIMVVTTLMRVAGSKAEFERLFERAFPKKKQIEIPDVLDLDKLDAK